MPNSSKSKRHREDNQKNAQKKGGESQLKVNQQSQSLVCEQCLQSFMNHQAKVALTHAQEKHPNVQLAHCFPGLAAGA